MPMQRKRNSIYSRVQNIGKSLSKCAIPCIHVKIERYFEKTCTNTCSIRGCWVEPQLRVPCQKTVIPEFRWCKIFGKSRSK